MSAGFAHALGLYLPLLGLGAAAGLVQVLARRSPPPRRRVLDLVWILLLLVGAPAWLAVAGALGWM